MIKIVLASFIIIFLTSPIVIRFGMWINYILRGDKYSDYNTADWSDVTVRILTAGDAEDVVQNTVNSVSDTDAAIQVISENPIDIDSATVHVVPSSFDVKADNKARALEWANRNLTKRDYILFLDEDSALDSVKEIPKGDLIQLREKPVKTNSVLCWLASIQRFGVEEESYYFSSSNPRYVWGGGLFVDSNVEDEIGWNFDTLREDDAFAYEAVEKGYDYEIVEEPKIISRSPLGIYDIIQQRRRWNSIDAPFIQRLRQEIKNFETSFVWGINSLVLPLFILTLIINDPFIYALILPSIIFNTIWVITGAVKYGVSLVYYPMIILIVPIISFYNGFGNLYSIFNPINEFNVTDKES